METQNTSEINITNEEELITTDSVPEQGYQPKEIHKETNSINEYSVCPSCGFKNLTTDIKCKECGVILKKQNKYNKKAISIILLVVIIVLLLVGAFFGVRFYRISKSEATFKIAEQFLTEEKYDEALSSYALVIKEDAENYKVSQEKIKKINEQISCFKRCAKALVAAETTCPYFDSDQILNIYYPEKNSAYEMMYGDETVTIVSKFLSTECTFIISNKKDASLETSFPLYYNAQFNLYIHAIGVENYTKGWLTSGWDIVTGSYETMAKSYCKEANVEYVKKYVDEFYDSKDESVFAEK